MKGAWQKNAVKRKNEVGGNLKRIPALLNLKKGAVELKEKKEVLEV